MLCPNCGQELSDQETICPGCGQSLTPEPVFEMPEELESSEPTEESAEPAEESAEPAEESAEPAEESAEPAEDAEGPEKPAKKKTSTLAIVMGAIIGLLLIVVVCLTIVLTTLSRTGSMPGFVTAISDFFHRDHFDGDALALTVEDENGEKLTELSNAQLSYYFWGEYYYYVQSNGFPFDAAKPLDEQNYSDEMTWQDFFLQNAYTSLQQIEALKAEAEAEGFTMPEDYQTEFDNTITAMTDYAVQAGFAKSDGSGDTLAYIQDSYGSAATEESFRQYLFDSYYVTAYSDTIYEGITLSEDQVEQYYDDNAEMFTSYGIEKSEQPNVNVRHILIQPADNDADAEDSAAEQESEEAAWSDAEAEAQRILKEWKDGEATEESFGELANTYSTDGGSNTNGGLYEDVYPGQMVQEFNDWCFDPDRKTGDTDIVKTSYGYHILYFVGATENYYWKETAENELHYQQYNEKLGQIVDRYTVKAADTLEVSNPDAYKEIQANAAAQAKSSADSSTEASGSAEG